MTKSYSTLKSNARQLPHNINGKTGGKNIWRAGGKLRNRHLGIHWGATTEIYLRTGNGTVTELKLWRNSCSMGKLQDLTEKYILNGSTQFNL